MGNRHRQPLPDWAFLLITGLVASNVLLAIMLVVITFLRITLF